mgnify:CR=1 FL=1
MNVLSLFDGMSCGRIALDRLGIPVDNYYASEKIRKLLRTIGIGFLVRKRPKKKPKRRIKGANNMSETRTVINQIKKQIEQNEMLIEAIERYRKQQLQTIKKEILALKADER